MKKLLYTLFLFCLFVACDNDDDVTNEAGVSFVIAPSTRANEKTSFSDGDAIGVYAVDKATGLASSGNICDNKKYVFASSTQSFKAASQADKIFNYDNKDLEFYVYYPYSSSIDDATNVMHVLSGVREDDFLVAKTSGSGNALPLNFRHLLSKIRVNYTPDQASSDLSMSVNTYKACVINLANNQIDKVGNRAALLLEKTQLESVTEFAGVIVPQTYTQSTLFGTITAGGKPYSFSFPADRTFASGEENEVAFMGSENQYIFSATPASISSVAAGSTTSLNVISTKSKTINGVVQPGTTESIGYSLTSKPDWVTISGNTILVAENTSLSARSGDIVYTQETSGNSATINVTQDAAAITYGSWVVSVSANPTTIAPAGGTSAISATASRDVFTNGTKTSTETATPSLAASGTGFSLSGTTLTASNNTGAARSCVVAASHGGVSKTVTVTQSAVSVTYGSWVVSVSANPTTIAPAGGTSAISATASRDVFTNGTKTSTETATPSLAASGTGFSLSGTTLTASNNTGAARSCTVTASYGGVSKIVTVTQSAAVITYDYVFSFSDGTTSKTWTGVSATGATNTFTINSYRKKYVNGTFSLNEDVSYSGSANVSWITLTGSSVIVADNNTTSPRGGVVTFTQGTSGLTVKITVTQLKKNEIIIN